MQLQSWRPPRCAGPTSNESWELRFPKLKLVKKNSPFWWVGLVWIWSNVWKVFGFGVMLYSPASLLVPQCSAHRESHQICGNSEEIKNLNKCVENLREKLRWWKQKQARKPRSYASLKLRLTYSLTHLLTRVKSTATSVAKNRSGEESPRDFVVYVQLALCVILWCTMMLCNTLM